MKAKLMIKLLENTRENLCDFGLGKYWFWGVGFLETSERPTHKIKTKLNFIKMKNVYSAKRHCYGKVKPQTGEKYFQITFLTKNLYLEYIKNSENSITKNLITKFSKRFEETPLQRWQISILDNVKHHYTLGK